MTSPREDPLAADLARLPAPALDAELAARVRRRARLTVARGPALRLDEAAVPALLVLAGVFYTVTSLELVVRIFTTS